MKKDVMLGNNRIEDVRWLCSLSKSELDLLVTLKKLAIRRMSSILKSNSTTANASLIDHNTLSKRLDLKMLRDLSFVLMQVVKDRLGEESRVADSNLVKHEICEEFREMSVEELMAYVRPDRKKRRSKLVKNKKKKRIAVD